MSDQQRKLFQSRPSFREETPCRLFASVVFDRPMRTMFTYGVPKLLESSIAGGKRVLAPFGKGNRRTTGYCVDVTSVRPDAALLKVIHSVVDEIPIVGQAMLDLTHWMAEYYFCSWGQVLEGVLPRAVKSAKGTRWAIFLHAAPSAGKDPKELTLKQKRVYEAVVEAGGRIVWSEAMTSARCGPEVLRTLVAKGWATMSRERVYSRDPGRVSSVPRLKPLELSAAQREAVEKIVEAVQASRPERFLLRGVTGSGKTEVYLQAIEATVASGREAIVLVPEISLTPQTIQRFSQRFDRIAVLHSHLSDVDRNASWRRIAAGDVQVVIGARSAVFAPCPRLGLIVIDEEHETTFKQESTPRYHARSVAMERARREGAPLVLGTATPSLESWVDALRGDATLLTLPERATGRPLPKVQIIDMRQEFKAARRFQAVGEQLGRAMRETLSTGGQVILLLNRRGYSTAVMCPLCGRVEMCRHCDVVLTFHREFGRMLCHTCDAEYEPPERCAACGGAAIKFSGFGTERLAEEVAKRFPDHPFVRMDGDTMRSVAQYEKALSSFRDGDARILLGTQMIAKGLDFPNVHLVGVVSADSALHLPDFRAAERTFQLLAQVAGRTGRGDTPGRVLVQTFHAEERSILAAAEHDFLRFSSEELPVREAHRYPPFETLCRVIVRATKIEVATEAAARVGEAIRSRVPADGSIRVLGPAPAPIPKVKDFHRLHLQLQAPNAAALVQTLDAALAGIELPGDAEYAVDVDPVSML